MKKFTPCKTLAILAFCLSGLSINAHATCNVDEVCVTGIRYTYDQGIEMYQKNYREDLNKVLQNQGVNSFMIGVAIDAEMKKEMTKVVENCLAQKTARDRQVLNLNADLDKNLSDWQNNGAASLSKLDVSKDQCKNNVPAAIQIALDFSLTIKGPSATAATLNTKLLDWSNDRNKQTEQQCVDSAIAFYGLAYTFHKDSYNETKSLINDKISKVSQLPQLCQSLNIK